MNHNVFFITTIEVVNKEDQVFSRRTPGFCSSLENAKTVVEENKVDIFETIYLYAVIEEIGPYLYPTAENSWWYKWDKEKERYCPIENDTTVEVLKRLYGGTIAEIG